MQIKKFIHIKNVLLNALSKETKVQLSNHSAEKSKQSFSYTSLKIFKYPSKKNVACNMARVLQSTKFWPCMDIMSRNCVSGNQWNVKFNAYDKQKLSTYASDIQNQISISRMKWC